MPKVRETPYSSSFDPVQRPTSRKAKNTDEPQLDVHLIQGNILAGFNKDNQTLIFLKIHDPEQFKHWLGQITRFVATTEEVLDFNRLFKKIRYRRKVESRSVLSTWLNIAFSFKGLMALDPEEADKFRDKAFRDGLAKRSRSLNDPADGPGSQEEWLIGGEGNEADVVLIVASDSIEEMAWALRHLESWIYEGAVIGEKLVPSGASVIFKQRGATLPGALAGHEHFGFLDGVSQPGIRGTIGHTTDLITPRQSPGEPDQGKPGQDCLWPGEFIFGYAGQDPTDIHKKGMVKTEGPSWSKNGSFLVFRRLRQDVRAFHEFLEREGERLGLGPELLGAKCVGRWASGTPIERAPEADNLKMSRDDCANNAFDFQKDTVPQPPDPHTDECKDKFPESLANADKDGQVCPFAGHIRKAYPRDDVSLKKGPLPNEADTETHRLLRRGIPFGDAFDPTIDPDDGNRGLLFLAYQTSIENQFEYVIKEFVNNPEFKDRGLSGHDPILGQSDESDRERFFYIMLDKDTKRKICVKKEWVIPTGGGYFFSPSIEALEKLSKSSD